MQCINGGGLRYVGNQRRMGEPMATLTRHRRSDVGASMAKLLCGAADCGLQIDRSIAVIVRGVDDVLALAARLLESPSRAINCTTTRGASHAGGEPRVVASRRDRRAPPMGGVRRERRGGGHRRGWRDDWSCRGRAGRRLGVASEQAAAAVVVLLEFSPIFFGGRSSQNLWARFLSAFSWEGLLARPVGCKYLT